MKFRNTFSAVLIAFTPIVAGADSTTKPAATLFPPRSPEESLKAVHVLDRYEVELVASEPQIESPVAIDWGADGSLWVVEMRDYPTGMDGKGSNGGRIKHLRSSHNDGNFDQVALVADNLHMPNGICTWKDGVIVTAAPDILYLHVDAADHVTNTEVLFTGFGERNPQLRVNGLRWGMDGWLYCATGLSGGLVHAVYPPGNVPATQPADLKTDGRDVRINPDSRLIELESGPAQYGRDRDDYGNWFGGDNSNPLFHYVLEDRYLRRNHDVAPPIARRQLITPPNAPVFALSANKNLYDRTQASPGHPGRHTSACSTTIYRDELLFPRDGSTHAFACEPVHNLVTHRVLKPDGISFIAERAPDEQDKDFFVSEDPWCRPVMVRMGPDGALWVVDMYRYMVEHPAFMPEGGPEKMGPLFQKGLGMGRIYRVYPKGKRPGGLPKVIDLNEADLPGQLKSTNGWVRDKAQQLCLWRDTGHTHEAVAAIAAEQLSTASRIQVLWTRRQLRELGPKSLTIALKDSDASVRREALKIVEHFGTDDDGVRNAARTLVEDPDAKVRLQLACMLGEAWPWNSRSAALAKLAAQPFDDPQWVGAVMGSVSMSATVDLPIVAEAVLASDRSLQSPVYRDMISLALAENNRGILGQIVSKITTPVDGKLSPQQITAFSQFVEVLGLHRTSLAMLAKGQSDELAKRLAESPKMFEAARVIALDNSAAIADRTAAISLLGAAPLSMKSADKLITLLSAQTPPEIQAAAVKAIARVGDPKTPELLISRWASFSPATRGIVIDVLAVREPWAWELINAVKAGTVPPLQFDITRRNRILKNPSERIRTLATELFGAAKKLREKVVLDHLKATSLSGDPTRGMKVFANICATCHHIGTVGNEIGPDLRSVSGWTDEALLVAILDPNRQVEPRYLSYSAQLLSGDIVFGIITADTPDSVTIKGLDAKEVTIPRSSIKSLDGGSQSLMPDGLEGAVSDQDLIDVIRFLQSTSAVH